MGLLVRREHSRKELARKLEARGVDGDEAEATVARMAEAGWQDDARFAAGLARSRALAGYGPLRIRAELATHGLGEDQVRAAFEALAESGDDDWRAMARGLVQRRHGVGVADDPCSAARPPNSCSAGASTATPCAPPPRSTSTRAEPGARGGMGMTRGLGSRRVLLT